jgi:hypothetical protein
MARLAISKDFVETLAQLPKPVAQQVNKMIDLFRADPNHPSLHREHYNGQADPRAQTLRVNQGLRAIVLKRGGDQDFVLIDVFSHEKADYWMANTKASVNAVTGALELCDVNIVSRAAEALSSPGGSSSVDLLNGASDKDLQNLGIDAQFLPLLRKPQVRAELDVLVALLPDLQGEAVTLLADGMSVEEAYALILELIDSSGPAVVPDPDDLIAAAARPASSGQFRVFPEAGLEDILAQPFALWRVFLHPSQRKLAERVFSGSARVTGGPGTGKTVVAIHRARNLARRYPQARILLTTFTSTLASDLVTQLRTLSGAETDGRVEIVNIDKLAVRILRETSPKATTTPAKEEDVAALFADACNEIGGLAASFVRQEWEQIILAGAINSRDEYFKAARPGRGVRLNRQQRADVWEIVEIVTARLAKLGRRSWIQIASDAAEAAMSSGRTRYDHILIDEGQDLHPAHWRLLRALVGEGPDDMFIVADSQQRIYDRKVVLSRHGINVRGRSSVLRLNYRSTAEIVRWAVTLLGDEPTDDLDDGTADKRAYRSVLRGTAPVVTACVSTNAEIDQAVAEIRNLIEHGTQADEIVVATRLRESVDMVANRLNASGVPARVLGEIDGEVDKVHVATFHRLKGLEYRHVILLDVSEGVVPRSAGLTSKEDDPQQHNEDLARERSVLFVAATRARDSLHVSYHGRPSPFLPLS